MLRHLVVVLLLFGIACGSAIAQTDEIELVGGDVLRGRVVEQTEERVVFEHPVLGLLELKMADVARITLSREQEPPTKPVEPADISPTPPIEAAPEQTTLPAEADAGSRWKFTLDLGVNGSTGNTETLDVRLGLLGAYEDKSMRTKFDLVYYYGEADGDRNTNKFTAGARNDWLLSESYWFYFAEGRFDHDEFQSWDWRVSGAGGVGYEFYDHETFTLLGRVGLGAVYEQGSDNEGVEPEALLGLDLKWKITEKQTLAASTTFYPALGDVGEFRAISGLDWTLDLDAAKGLKLKFGLHHEYQSVVDSGVDRNDLKLFGGVALQF